MSDHGKTRQAFYFLCEKESCSQKFSQEELQKATGWSASTIKTYQTKNWKDKVIGTEDGFYTSVGIIDMTLNDFIALQKQTH